MRKLKAFQLVKGVANDSESFFVYSCLFQIISRFHIKDYFNNKNTTMRCRSSLQPYPIYTTLLTGQNIPAHLGYRPRIPPAMMELLEKEKRKQTSLEGFRQKIIQTMFRDSEAQTDPFVVDVVEPSDKGLEILTLTWLSWNKGLPVGMTEIRTIERARQKRAWEASLPIPFDKFSKDLRAMIVEAIEINEWNYREELIAAVGSLRMEIAEKLMKEKSQENKTKYETRLQKYIEAKKEEKKKCIRKTRNAFNRQIRKLTFARQKINMKYQRWNVIKLFADKTSELYAPLMRNGVDPRNWHEKIHPKLEAVTSYQKLEIMHQSAEDIPETPKPAFDFNKHSKPRLRATELCIRATKWTEQNLEKLYEQLRNIRRKRLITPKPLYLKKKVGQTAPEAETPFVEGVSEEEERIFKACLFLQRTIKGRAIQAVMFEGRVKYQELIEELKSTHALQHEMESVKAEMRKRVYTLQRQAEIEQMQERRKNEILCALEGRTTGEMLDFLAKELLRLQDERRTHAMALAADQERHKREAAEAGRRQVEEQRRREHDEMFKQVVKVHQNTVQAFMEDVMTENMNWLANRDARERVTEIAKTLDQLAKETVDFRLDNLREEEIIADLIHNFALPEAEKRIVRERLRKKQMNYLRVCHDEVYSTIEKAMAGPRDERGKLLPLPKVGKHKIPPLIRVKYLNLKRMHESSSSTNDSASGHSDVSVMNEQFLTQHKLKQDAERMLQEKLDRERAMQESKQDGNSYEDLEQLEESTEEAELQEQLEQKQQKQQSPDGQKWSSGFSKENILLKK